MSTRPVVLVHGAWHGAWCWAPLQAELDRRGVASLAVDLPGHGSTGTTFTDLHGDARAVAEVLDVQAGFGRTAPILVGHSYGGAVITEVAAGRSDVAHLVYLAAFALLEGETVMGALTAMPKREVGLSAAMRPGPDGTSTLDASLAVPALYGSCDPVVAAAAVARLSPQPMATMIQAVSGSPLDRVPSTYVVCERDDAVHPDHQRIMAERCRNTVTFDTDHSPFVSMTKETADLLESLARA
ncbi:MAG: alpha/beta fold hydrolase [Ilumatobacteraceae bacterium]